jgi:hypothetical protein
MLMVAWICSAGTAPAGDDGDVAPAEERRFGAELFREGLRQRGLVELLELHLQDYPPRDPVERLLLHRELKRTIAADTAVPTDQRREALAEANQLLEQLVLSRPDDRRRFSWRMQLARSLMYEEAEPHYTNLLLRGGTAEDRARLEVLMSKALGVLSTLRDDLIAEYDRLDKLDAREYENLERRGYIEEIDRLEPEVSYRLAWAWLFAALPRSPDDASTASSLHRTLELIAEVPGLLETPHETSHVQLDALVLAGMTYRRLNDHVTAKDHLDRALAVADRLINTQLIAASQWATRLAWIERARCATDTGQHGDALAILDRFRAWATARERDSYPVRLLAALAERDVRRKMAADAVSSGRPGEAESERQRSFQPLVRLVREEPDHGDEVFWAVYETVDAWAAPESLDAFEKSAAVAGLLHEANRATDPSAAERQMRRAVVIGEALLATAAEGAAELMPTVRYNLGVAYYRLAQPIDATRQFLAVARENAGDTHAVHSAVLAVQLMARVRGEPRYRDRPDVRETYADALETLVQRFPDTPDAKYWRFFFAQWLEENDHYSEAADQYALVESGHEHHLDALFFCVRAMARAMEQQAADPTVDPLDARRQRDEFVTAHQSLLTEAAAALTSAAEGDRAAHVKRLQAEATVVYADAQLLPQFDRPAKTVEALERFEEKYLESPHLISRVLKTRLLAFERLGRLDDAAAAIPRFTREDPDGAGPTLQSLYQAFVRDAERLERAGTTDAARRKHESGLMVARELVAWAARPGRDLSAEQRALLDVQYAESLLHCGFASEAEQAFLRSLGVPVPSTDSADSQDPAASPLPIPEDGDPRAVIGYAESLFAQGRHAAALPLFNRLATRLPPREPMHWRALLRDLECRTELGEPPGGIIQVIRQRESMGSDLGGPAFADKFRSLLTRNERRLQEGSRGGPSGSAP